MAEQVRASRSQSFPGYVHNPSGTRYIASCLLIVVLISILSGLGVFTRSGRAQSVPHPMFDVPCLHCHSEKNFPDLLEETLFDHATTGFPLEGAHHSLTCRACHDDMVFEGTPTECFQCHEDIHNGELGNDCQRCHDTTTFSLVEDFTGFHETTRFPLRGVHQTLMCIDCHDPESDDQWHGLSTDCASCHYDDYASAVEPDHAAAGFSLDCAKCHMPEPEFRATFDHGITGTELTGTHLLLACSECHEGGFFRGLPSDCISCHQEDLEATTDPDHVAAGFSLECEQCHTADAWTPATFDHNATKYPLDGAHLLVSCGECHTAEFGPKPPTICSECHLEDYQNTTDPDHAGAGFPLTCEQCHTTIAWTPSAYDHDATDFPLAGGHEGILCAECHGDGVYDGLSRECVSCHRDDYDATTDLDHRALEFPLSCEECHTDIAWTPSLFDHNATVFPLEGAHQLVTCGQCHTDGYGLHPPTACIVCHFEDYGGAPEHASLGFPEDCTQCHSKDAWAPQPYDHPEFPIYSGHHSGEWNTCATCHTMRADFTVFSCFECHLQQETDSHHREVRNYSYVSSECYRCHLDGRE